MTPKNIIVGLLVVAVLFLVFMTVGRHYGGGMIGWSKDNDEMFEDMEEHMDEFNNEGEDVPTSADNAPPGMHNLPVPPAVGAVRSEVATELGISVGSVIVMSAYEQEWSDGCLGLGGPAESCLAAITPGYEVTVLAQGNERVFRTNADGSMIREEMQ